MLGLLDTGLINTLFDSAVAGECGIDLDGAARRPLAIGATTYEAAFVTVQMSAVGFGWEADVGFCDNWQPGWAILGHNAFFRYFVVTFRGADYEFDLTPIDR